MFNDFNSSNRTPSGRIRQIFYFASTLLILRCDCDVIRYEQLPEPVSMIVGHVLMLTLAAASLDLRILMRGWVVRMQDALLTCDTEEKKTQLSWVKKYIQFLTLYIYIFFFF